jgi:hypothetical protein
MKIVALRAVWFALLTFVLNACASSQTDVTGAGSAPTGAVPGETLPDDERIAPGGLGNPSPSVRW